MLIKNNNIKYKVNPNRLKYLLDLYNISGQEFIDRMNKNKNGDLRKKRLDLHWLDDVKNKDIKLNLNLVKRICRIFDVNLSWIISNYNLESRKGSIFFRKQKFNTDLDFIDKKIINNLEKLKIETQLLTKYIQYKPKRLFRRYNYLNDSARKAAIDISDKFLRDYNNLIEENYIDKARTEREYLSNLIRVLEKYNIFVFERVETWNQKERLNIDGMFMSPNFIFIKRNQKYFRKEIFTLMHEFAHYLLNIEEVDNFEDSYFYHELNKIEKWCHTFSFYFLLNRQVSLYDSLNIELDNFENKISEIYKNTHLSRRAIYTRLYIENRLNKGFYEKKIKELNQYVLDSENILKENRELAKQLGAQGGRAPKAIESKIFTELVKNNYYEGNISEYNLRKYLKIKPKESIVNIA